MLDFVRRPKMKTPPQLSRLPLSDALQSSSHSNFGALTAT
jgi:hypothetical protein